MVGKRSSLYLSLCAYPQQGQGIRSWDSNYMILCKTILSNSDDLSWWKKKKMRVQEILLNCFSRNTSHEKWMILWINPNPSMVRNKWHRFNENPLWRCLPFKVEINFDMNLIFEGHIDVDVLDKWLNPLEAYFFIHIFYNK